MSHMRTRLATLVFLTVIAALSAALFVQRRREAALNARVQALQKQLLFPRGATKTRIRTVQGAATALGPAVRP